MDGTVKVPGVGPVKKKYAVGGAVVLAVILGVAYYRHGKSASTAAAATATDTTGTQPDPNAIDPATGLTYAEEAAGIQSGTLAGYGTPYGDTSGLVGYSAQGQPIYSDQVGYGPSPSFVNNGSWAQAAQQYLVSSTGADAGTVAAALGAYLNGQVLSSAQASVVQSAIGFFGQPPDQGSSGYPPALRTGGPPDATVAVPNVVGQSAGNAHNAIVAAGLVPVADPGQHPGDKVTSTTPKAGQHVAHGSQVLITATASTPGGGGNPPPQQTVTVPNVVGHRAGDAHNILARAGLVPADPNARRRGEPQRIVGSESPRAGTRVARGTRVTITVRQG